MAQIPGPQGPPGPPGPAGPTGPAGPPGAGPSLDRVTSEKLFDALTEATTKGVERARAAGQFVQGAAAAIGTVYTAILALAFAADETTLPLRGVVPALFLAGAIVLAAFYVAFLSKPGGQGEPAYGWVTDDEPRMLVRAAWFINWSNQIASARHEFLRGAVVSLALGVLTLPIAFVDVGDFGSDASDSPTESPVAGASATPSPSPWPTPEFLEPPEVAAVLYAAQIEEFREGAGDKAEPSDDTGLVIGLAIGGLLAIYVIGWWNRILEWKPPS